MKCVILLYDINTVRHRDAREIGEWAHGNGYEMLTLGIDASICSDPKVIRVIDLSNLPPAEVEELRRLCAEKVQQ